MPRPTRRRPGRPPLSQEAEESAKAAILAAAERVFARRGYRETDVQEIADLAKVGKASVYRRFSSKSALFLAAVEAGVAAMQVEVRSAMAGVEDPLEKVRVGVLTYLAYWEARPDLVELMMQERTEFRGAQLERSLADREQAKEEARLLFGSLINAGLMRRQAADRFADVIFNLLYGTMYFNRLLGMRKSPAEQADDLLDVFFHGSLTEAGRRHLAGKQS